MFELKKGALYVVATPIGNLGDLSPRARDVLAGADRICAEDTRHTRQMLNALGLERPLLALHEHNEDARVAQVLSYLQAGESLALVSDAGTPLISDPGYRLVRGLRAAGVTVSPVPGPCAAIAALSVAGIASDRFCFEGFLPNKSTARRERLQALAAEPRTLVFYESAHRIEECLADMRAAFGDAREAVLAREITKLFETVLDGTLASIAESVGADPNQRKGEFVLVVAGAPEDADAALREGRRLYAKLAEVMKPSQAAKLAAELSGAPRKALYGGE
ncbi:ribosomal RNA small subunit methyltransferase I [Arenimonas maotaiensis]|uniref:Ribosomal RNA small subunit methyltransferase I n=1 Tax=Arenimonas maotaiensis TaxID=1446479 RepID=A0A917CIJ1_9GAMM|nr:16S rRNA (cytidine(1402)-2'-O)-methyltransferase [Arenimonas maotaiensis]GGF89911.1 ribosomal RNA small subunit methyltransferase I [Arenimonas maotaiensis]